MHRRVVVALSLFKVEVRVVAVPEVVLASLSVIPRLVTAVVLFSAAVQARQTSLDQFRCRPVEDNWEAVRLQSERNIHPVEPEAVCFR
jgi:hypothetical protein